MSDLAGRLQNARAASDSLFGLVRPDSFYERPIPERHRIIFYLGHLEAFDWNLLCRHGLEIPSFHAAFDELFRRGIDPSPGEAAEDQPSDWPSVEETRGYGRRTRALVDTCLQQLPDELVHTAIEHRLMHVETLAYILMNLEDSRKLAPPGQAAPALPPPAPAMCEIPAGSATLGLPRDAGFGWDNEFDAHTTDAPAFAISKYMVTNGEYLEFVNSGAGAPHFWRAHRDGWRLKLSHGSIALPADWPVWVTHAEASSYARWRGGQLPSEAQFHRAAYGAKDGEERPYPWGGCAPGPQHGCFNLLRWDPVPVTAHPAGESDFGVAQMVGNGWEWTSSAFAPFSGFKPAPYYETYSADFFDGEHFVLKGAAPVTPSAFLRRSFRNWFRGEYPYMFAGFRLVET